MQAHLAKTYPGILQGRAILSVGHGLQRGNRSSSKANTWPAWPVEENNEKNGHETGKVNNGALHMSAPKKLVGVL